MTSAIPVQRSNQRTELSSQLGAGHLRVRNIPADGEDVNVR